MNTEQERITPVRMRRVRLLGALLLFASCWTAVTGCGRYPQVQNRASIELIAALRTACSSQRTDRLDRCAEAIEERRAAGELPDVEYDAFQAIIVQARAGKWKEAEMETYRFQEAQVR